MFQSLASQLLSAHGKNVNGVLLTDYSRIRGLKVHASTTNGTSGIGIFNHHKVYWHLNSGFKWDGVDVVKVSEPFFEVERARTV